ncbi:MAG: alpha-L-fucosidase [Bacteroidota bacterium]|nr:alpha-L-fucosidase [Bacteroidota bacterium]
MNTQFVKQTGVTTLLVTALSLFAAAQLQVQPKDRGPFKPTEESLKQYKYPEWFRDAKFGIWAHWGPQAVPRHGDWYARQMYEEGSDDYRYHLAHYGHPSEFGYKDIIPLWKAQRWDPEKLMALYKKAGARYFVSMGTHHDDFFLWNSRIHRWNAVNYGPKKDVVGIWQKAAKEQGLKFGVSEHLGASFTWFQSSHGADTIGPKKGVPYDGANPMYQDLYHAKTEPGDNDWLSNNEEWHREWLFSIKELIDNYHPDLLYSDSGLPFGEYGRNMIAHFYNQNMAANGGDLEAVYTCKQASEGMWVQDLERGVKDSVSLFPWQTDTSIGDWFYRTGQKYKTATEIIQMLVDIVSKNGNLLINIVQTPEGDLEPDVLNIVEDIASWNAVNGDGIFGTRPWKIYGEKPLSTPVVASDNFNEDKVKYTAQDIRFTQKGDTVYAFCLGVPDGDIRIASLGRDSRISAGTISSVRMMGSNAKLHWKQKAGALIINKPSKLPVASVQVIGFKIEFKHPAS